MSVLKNILIVDLDGTLLRNGLRVIDPKVKSILYQLQQNNQLVINSARHPTAIKTALGHEVSFISSIALNGAALYCSSWERPDKFHFFWHQQTEAIIHSASQENITLSAYTMRNWYASRFDNFIKDESLITKMKPKPFNSLNINKEVVLKFTALSNSEALNLFKEKLYKDFRIKSAISNKNYLELSPIGIDKSSLLPEFLQHIGISKYNSTIYFWGDSYNDIPCAKFADYAYAFNDSPDELKLISNKIFDIDISSNTLACLNSILEVWN